MPVTETSNFFQQKRTSAEIKTELIQAYFPGWCAYWLQQTNPAPDNILYVDLLAGPVLQADNIPAGPALILNQIHQSAGTELDLNATVQTFFLDPAKAAVESLTTDLAQLPYLEQLANPPVILNEPEAQDSLIKLLNQQIHALLVTDPFGYQYAQEMLMQAAQNGQTDLLLVFNPAKIKAALHPKEEYTPLEQFFGSRWQWLKVNYQKESSARRKEQLTVEALTASLSEKRFYPVTFKINLPDKDQTSHYVVFAARAKDSYLQMKELMATYSDYQPDGVPLFAVNQKPAPPLLPGFFEYLSKYTQANLLTELSHNRSRFHYQTIKEIYQDHSPGTNYIKANYLQALEELRQQGRINLVDAKNKQVKKLSDSAIVFYKLHGGK